MYVVEDHWHPVTGGLGQTYIARYDTFKYLGSEEAAQILRDLLRKRGAVVVHRKEDAFDSERRIDRTAKAHESIKELGYALERQIFALNRNEYGIGCSERVESKKVEGRRAVEKNECIAMTDAVDDRFQAIFAVVH